MRSPAECTEVAPRTFSEFVDPRRFEAATVDFESGMLTPPHLVLLGEHCDGLRNLVESLADERGWTLTVAAQNGLANWDVDQPVDMVVVVVARGSLAPLAYALGLREDLDRPEYVFVVDSPDDPVRSGLEALGVDRVLDYSNAATWIRKAAPVLSRITRARRNLRDARRDIPPLPDKGDEESTDEVAPLFEAEQRFRETYVRRLLSRTKSRAEAAERANVPYRTFFHILAKLGIKRG